MTYLTGRRMVPAMDHRRVYWWGEKKSLTVLNLDNLTSKEFPMACGTAGSKLVTYDVLVSQQKLVYIMCQNDVHKFVYFYDLHNQDILGIWKYENELFEEEGIKLRSISAIEKLGLVAIGGQASEVGSMALDPFVSLHRLCASADFPEVDTMVFNDLEGSVTALEFIKMAKKPTLLACDARCIIVLQVLDGKLERHETIKIHECKEYTILLGLYNPEFGLIRRGIDFFIFSLLEILIEFEETFSVFDLFLVDINALAHNRFYVVTGSDDHSITRIEMNKEKIKFLS